MSLVRDSQIYKFRPQTKFTKILIFPEPIQLEAVLRFGLWVMHKFAARGVEPFDLVSYINDRRLEIILYYFSKIQKTK